MLSQWENAVKNVSILEVVEEGMNAYRSDIIRLNQEQLMQGVKSSGGRLSEYSAPYAKRKGKPLNPKTLKDTGAFHDSIYAKVFKDFTEIGANDIKSAWIEDQESHKSGDDPDEIYSLTEDNLDRLLDEFGLRDFIIERYKQKLLAS